MINLLPPERLASMRLARSNTVLLRYLELIVISMFVLIMAIVAAQYFLNTQQKNTQQLLDINQKKVKELEPVQKEAEELSATVNTISSLLSKNVKFSEMLTQIGGLMPPGSVLTGLQFSIEDLKAPLAISAQVEDEQKAAVLRNNLANSSLFSKVEIKTITTIEEDDPAASQNNPYKFTTMINAYFKESVTEKKNDN